MSNEKRLVRGPNVTQLMPAKYNLKACMNMSDVILNADDFSQFLTGYEPMGFLGGEPAV